MTKQAVYVIAEAGVNHNGDRDMAFRLIDAAADAGADAVKFQTFKASSLAVNNTEKAAYQKQTTSAEETQTDMLRRLELPFETFVDLEAHAAEKGIDFLSTPFDLDSLDFLYRSVKMRYLKIPSGEVTNGPLLLAGARRFPRILLSTGMATLDDIEAALGVLAFGYISAPDLAPSIDGFRKAFADPAGQEALRGSVTLLQCTTAYPTPFEDANIRAMDTLGERFGLRSGFSDHTVGIAIPIAAAARGATVIEKHFTLDRNLPGPDHAASLELTELKAMIDGIRAVEAALGDGVKQPTKGERETANVVRKVLVASKAIKIGEAIDETNLTVKRGGQGITAMDYWDWVGRVSERNFDADEVIT